MPQTRQLRKDEPHPVGLLVSIDQLFNDLTIDLNLGVYEANEIGIQSWDRVKGTKCTRI